MKGLVGRYPSRETVGIRGLSVLAAVLIVAAAAPAAQAEEGWEWSLTPYLWASAISEDLYLDGSQTGGSDTSFDELVDLVETSIQLHFEGTRDRWGMFADISYVDLADTEEGQFLTTEVDISELAGEAGAIYRPGGRDGSLDVLFGVRLLSVDETYVFTFFEELPFEFSIDEDHWDLMAGLRYNRRFKDRWLLNMRGDLSLGGTDYIWTAQVGGGWLFGSRRQHALLLGYRYRQLDYSKSDRFDVEKTMDGFITGVKIGF